MRRREFLRASSLVGLASLSGGVLPAQDPSPIPRLPGESEAAYRTRLARSRAAEAARRRAGATTGDQPSTTRHPNESEAAYRTRLARMRAEQAARRRGSARDYYELRRYEIETQPQKAGFDTFASEAAIPALNRIGIEPVGVFYPWEDLGPIYVLLRHRSLESFATLTQRLSDDEEFLQKGQAFLNAPADGAAYKRMESSLMMAFEGMPRLETPVKSAGRVLQLRTYESPSVKTGQKKIEMFNTGEIAIFRKVGLHPVFFGETLSGAKMPNLTYMLAFEDMQERKANWKRFGGDPDWKALRSTPGYADKEILCGITNLYLRPASYSQI